LLALLLQRFDQRRDSPRGADHSQGSGNQVAAGAFLIREEHQQLGDNGLGRLRVEAEQVSGPAADGRVLIPQQREDGPRRLRQELRPQGFRMFPEFPMAVLPLFEKKSAAAAAVTQSGEQRGTWLWTLGSDAEQGATGNGPYRRLGVLAQKLG